MDSFGSLILVLLESVVRGQVYYTPLAAPFDQASVPTLFGFLPMLRDILVREQIQIVHAHQATSQLTHEALFHARALQLRTAYTDHSLFGFGDLASINVNKVLRFTLAGVDRCVCVSHTCRENLVLRACVDPARVVTLPNAVDRLNFNPDFSKRPGTDDEVVHVVVMSRMVYRKGIDLLVGVIPLVCARFPQVRRTWGCCESTHPEEPFAFIAGFLRCPAMNAIFQNFAVLLFPTRSSSSSVAMAAKWCYCMKLGKGIDFMIVWSCWATFRMRGSEILCCVAISS